MKSVITLALLATAIILPAHAQQTASDRAARQTSAALSATALNDGEVRKVDKDAKKITLRHGPIANLGMPPMTMVFQVKDPAFLDRVKAGDKVRFAAEQTGGAYIVTQIEPAK